MAERDRPTEWLRVQLYRRMTPQQRIEIAAQLFEDGASIVRSSILDRDPQISPEALQFQIRRRVRGCAASRWRVRGCAASRRVLARPRGLAELTRAAGSRRGKP